MSRPSTTPTLEVFVGESRPYPGIWVRENGALVTGLAAGHTFKLRVATIAGALVFEKTTGIVGQAGTGFPPRGTPNVVVQWAATGELDQLSEGTYRAQLVITGGDGKERVDEFQIRARARI